MLSSALSSRLPHAVRLQVRTASLTMGGRRHKGIGMNRPKKSKVAVAEVPEVINESEEDSDHEEEPEPEPQPESHTLPAAAPAVPVAADCLAASPAIPTCGTKRQRGRPAQTPLQREEKKVQAAYRAWEQAEDDFDPWCEGATRAMLDAAGCTFENMSEHGKWPAPSLEARLNERCRKKRANIEELWDAYIEAAEKFDEMQLRERYRIAQENHDMHMKLMKLEVENARLRTEQGCLEWCALPARSIRLRPRKACARAKAYPLTCVSSCVLSDTVGLWPSIERTFLRACECERPDSSCTPRSAN